MKEKSIKTKKSSKIKAGKEKAVSATMGLLLLIVATSITWSTYTVVVGVDGLTSKIMVIPQALFAAAVLIKQATK